VEIYTGLDRPRPPCLAIQFTLYHDASAEKVLLG
jgi:hypothetical protein